EIERAHHIEGEAGNALKARLAALPNIAEPEVPDGEDESGNVEVDRWSDRAAVPAGRLNATPKDHVDLGAALGMMDFEAAAKMSGARFVVLKSQLARMERALGQFMLDHQSMVNGYMEVSPPLLVNADAMFGTGQLPKF
ncbi:serine--tRNA ligase, partial [Mycobacterium tuberculosis]